MSRYLNRAPVMGDRVLVTFEGVCTYGPDYVTLDNGIEIETAPLSGSAEWMRVIAPEPKVGAKVTADMDLPPYTVLGDGSMAAVRAADGDWYFTNTRGPVTWVQVAALPWTILQLGRAS